MNCKFILLFAFKLLLVQGLFAQVLQVQLDDEEMKAKTMYSYYPHKLQVAVMKGNTSFEVVKGTFSIVRNGRKLHTETLTDAENWSLLQNRKILPGSRLIVEVQEIKAPDTGKVSKVRLEFVVQFKEELKAKAHPDYKLLLNNTTTYLHDGINPKAIQQLEFVLTEDYLPERIVFYHARGRLLVREEIRYSDLTAATTGLQDILKDASVKSGDRIVVELIGNKSAVITIPIAN